MRCCSWCTADLLFLPRARSTRTSCRSCTRSATMFSSSMKGSSVFSRVAALVSYFSYLQVCKVDSWVQAGRRAGGRTGKSGGDGQRRGAAAALPVVGSLLVDRLAAQQHVCDVGHPGGRPGCCGAGRPSPTAAVGALSRRRRVVGRLKRSYVSVERCDEKPGRETRPAHKPAGGPGGGLLTGLGTRAGGLLQQGSDGWPAEGVARSVSGRQGYMDAKWQSKAFA